MGKGPQGKLKYKSQREDGTYIQSSTKSTVAADMHNLLLESYYFSQHLPKQQTNLCVQMNIVASGVWAATGRWSWYMVYCTVLYVCVVDDGPVHS